MARFAARFVVVPAAVGTAAILLLQGFGTVNVLGRSAPVPHRPTVRALPLAQGGPLSDDPFVGTPAETFPAGADGIHLPDPSAQGPLDAARVRTALAGVKSLLVAAQLDHGTLFEGDYRPFTKALDPGQRHAFLSHLDDAVRRGDNTRTWMTAFKPGKAEPEGDTIKVTGTFELIPVREGVRIRTDHLFVYPVHAPGYPVEWVTIVTRRTTEVLATPSGKGVKLHLVSTKATNNGTSCGANDGFVHPVYPGSPEAKFALPDPYDLSVEMKEQTCLNLGG